VKDAPAASADADEKLLTAIGVSRPTEVPFPSSPLPLEPQQSRVLSANPEHVWVPLAIITPDAADMPDTEIGVLLLEFVPFPSWPLLL
jgi:hypothetical protein